MMEFLGNYDLFTSHFVIGCHLCDNESIEDIRILHDWINFKDEDPFMDRYRSDRTQYIDFLHYIPIDHFKGIMIDLAQIYQKAYPFGTIDEFKYHVFDYSVWKLREMQNWELYFMMPPPHITKDCYYTDDKVGNEIIDIIIEPDKTPLWFKQYYRKIIELINDFEFEQIENINPPQNNETFEEDKIEETKEIYDGISNIEKYFSFLSSVDDRKHVQILPDSDYTKLISWLEHFYNNNFEVPEITNPIKTVNTSKGNIIYALKSYFKELFPEKSFPNSLFDLYKKAFYQYRNDNEKNFLKTSKPKYFDQLTRNNN